MLLVGWGGREREKGYQSKWIKKCIYLYMYKRRSIIIVERKVQTENGWHLQKRWEQ